MNHTGDYKSFQVYTTTTEAARGSSHVRQTATQKEDYAFLPNRPFTEIETNERVGDFSFHSFSNTIEWNEVRYMVRIMVK